MKQKIILFTMIFTVPFFAGCAEAGTIEATSLETEFEIT